MKFLGSTFKTFSWRGDPVKRKGNKISKILLFFYVPGWTKISTNDEKCDSEERNWA